MNDLAGPIDVAPGVWVSCDARGPVGAPRIVILPPLGGSGALFDPFRASLAEDHDVLTVEPPGSGDAAAPSGLPSTRALARDVISALDRIGLQRAHLFGISLGGMVAQWIAIDAPDRVDRLILASTAARGLSAVAIGAQQLAMARALLLPSPTVELAEVVISDEVLEDRTEKARIEDAASAHPRGRAEILWLAAAAAAHDTREHLAKIAAPTLILSGDTDELVPRAAQSELAAAIPGATHIFIEHAGHDLTVEQPAATAGAIRAFLRGQR